MIEIEKTNIQKIPRAERIASRFCNKIDQLPQKSTAMTYQFDSLKTPARPIEN
jgi:hypothetical protein